MNAARASILASRHRPPLFFITIALVTWLSVPANTSESRSLPPAPDHIAAALAHPDRSDADRQRDVDSHPDAVMRFLNIRSGMTVLDLLAGSGYYSELLARAVGESGRVYLHNNQGYQGLMRSLPRRLRGDGLESLTVYVREIEDINLPSDSVDLVLMVKVYHDFYYRNNGWAIQPDSVFRTVHRILKPGGVLAVIDHRAPTGTRATFAQNLHRIAADFAREDIESRGFRLESASELLANPEDDGQASPFEPALRGRTDRFLHRYVKVLASASDAP